MIDSGDKEMSNTDTPTRIIEVESQPRRELHTRRRFKRMRPSVAGLITLADGRELMVVDTTKGMPAVDTVIAEMPQTPSTSGNIMLVTDDYNVLTCREVEPEDKYPRLEPEWLTARIKELVEYDEERGIDENLENEEDRQPTGEELGIRPGQLWVRRTATGNRVTRSTTGYPHLVQVNTTDAAWRGLVSVNIILPAVLNHKSFNIKPFFLLEAYELYLNETSYL